MAADEILTATALAAVAPDGREAVSVHVKRTYRILSSGKCQPADDQKALLAGDIMSDGNPVPETDVVPYKAATDLIVLASAHAPRKGTTEMKAGIQVGTRRVDFAVFGDRRCLHHGPGSIRFSRAEPFERIPIRYENAYGGVDRTVPDPPVNHLVDLFALHPGVYPRNPEGRGYVVQENRQVIDQLVLPNIESPADLLTPERLVTGAPSHWWRQPVPWSCDWFAKTWYPRISFYGGLPDHIPDDDRQMAEVRMGWVARGQRARSAQLRLEDVIDVRSADAASPALVLPFLTGAEQIKLTGMTPQGTMVVELPGDVPRILVRWRGKAHEVEPVPNRVLLSLEDMGAYVVWHGLWPISPKPPLRLPRTGDTPSTALEGIDVIADGRKVEPLQ